MLIEFEGRWAHYTGEERAFMRRLPRGEMSFIHELKATFDAKDVTRVGH